MFGHDDKEEKQDNNQSTTVVQPMSTQPPDENLLGVTNDATDTTTAVTPLTDTNGDEDIDKIVDDINARADNSEPTKIVASTPADASVAPLSATDSDSDDEDEDETDSASPDDSGANAELMSIKKSALQELSPLLDELDQGPEEKLNVIMMTIQASDDQTLIPQAFETAKKIEDKKARAEAMLDIINEINYFTKKAS